MTDHDPWQPPQSILICKAAISPWADGSRASAVLACLTGGLLLALCYAALLSGGQKVYLIVWWGMQGVASLLLGYGVALRKLPCAASLTLMQGGILLYQLLTPQPNTFMLMVNGVLLLIHAIGWRGCHLYRQTLNRR
ncbi:hypothetical protein [Leeia aquatica]|uniref:Uncharacterized protein n=1 Tax=Leeia aquatica TaxID=2725557 RepID=A0A847S9V6_9NEIS|nr:hypothetical protein [Leeia aquatica]NLR75727.1 hypothetical protein [Leeia aquatica]